MSSLTQELDKIAEALEAVDPRISLALDKVSDQIEKQANLRNFLKLIPGLPTLAEAKKVITGVNPAILKKLISGIQGIIPKDQAKEADVGGILTRIKTLAASLKVSVVMVLSVLVLMAFDALPQSVEQGPTPTEQGAKEQGSKGLFTMLEKARPVQDKMGRAIPGCFTVVKDGKKFFIGRSDKNDAGMAEIAAKQLAQTGAKLMGITLKGEGKVQTEVNPRDQHSTVVVMYEI